MPKNFPQFGCGGQANAIIQYPRLVLFPCRVLAPTARTFTAQAGAGTPAQAWVGSPPDSQSANGARYGRSSHVIAILLAALALVSTAADGLKATVTATGSVDVLPTELHVILTFKQKAGDAKAALVALKSAREATLAKLPGVDPAKAREETPTVVEKAGSNAMAAAMAAARGNRLKRRGNDDPVEVTLQQVVRVPVTFSGKDLLAITLEAEGMKAAVFTSKAMPDQAEPEVDPEMANYAMMGMTGKQRGPVEFEFVAPRTPELEQKAYAAALKSAREKAASIAAAAGLKTADVASVTLQESDSAGGTENMAMSYYRALMGAAGASASKPSDIVSGDTSALSVKVTLLVECTLK